MKRTLPAGRIALGAWMAAAVIMTAVMALCPTCGATPIHATIHCAAQR